MAQHKWITQAAFYALALLPVMLILQRWAADALTVAIGLLFLLHSFLERDWQWLQAPPVRIILALWIYTLGTAPLGLDPMSSLVRAALWLRYILLFAAIAYWLSAHVREMRHAALWTLAVLCLLMLDAFVQYLTGESLSGRASPASDRLSGPMTHMVVGILLAKLSFPVLGLLLYHAWPNRRMTALYGIAATAVLALIILSSERTALMSYLIGLGVIGALLFPLLKNARLWVVGFALAQAAVLVTLYASQPQFENRVGNSVQMLETFKTSPYAQLWNAAYGIWQEHPFTGVGLGNFRKACPALLDAGAVSYCDLHPHNLYLEWLSETGAIGFLFFAAFAASLLYAISRRLRHAAGNECILIAFAFAGLVPTLFPFNATQSFFVNWPAILAWLSVALSFGLVQRIRHG